jgi:triosephosphate isomerase (TIM)
MKLIIANWKAYKNFTETQQWLDSFLPLVDADEKLRQNLGENKLEIIICPPVPFIGMVKERIKTYQNIHVGAQNISSVEEGKFTGEITAKSLFGLVDYAIIGHSERRTIYHEQEEAIAKKTLLAQQFQIEPILCIRDEKDQIYPHIKIIAYEPESAIGTGNNMHVSQVVEMKKKLGLTTETAFLYGGSVTKDTYSDYLASGEIDGLLIGAASLDPNHFHAIVSKV